MRRELRRSVVATGRARTVSEIPSGRPVTGTTRIPTSRAIHRACDRRAMQAAEGYPFAAGKGDTVGRWYKRLTGISKDIVVKHINNSSRSPNRLRHAMATEVRQQFGLEAAQITLGHAAADVTQIYAERDMKKGIEVARKIG